MLIIYWFFWKQKLLSYLFYAWLNHSTLIKSGENVWQITLRNLLSVKNCLSAISRHTWSWIAFFKKVGSLQNCVSSTLTSSITFISWCDAWISFSIASFCFNIMSFWTWASDEACSFDIFLFLASILNKIFGKVADRHFSNSLFANRELNFVVLFSEFVFKTKK